MSLGVEDQRMVRLRAVAHPVRLRMLSLLTGAELTAAEVARELDLTHANASYHLRQLLAAGLLVIAGEERIRGGVAKRYRYDLDRDPRWSKGGPERPETAEGYELMYAAVATELRRRASHRVPGPAHLTDAEVWVDPAEWKAVRDQVTAVSDRLHRAARPPRTPGTIRVNASMALFPMEPSG
jgi:DNA-binding transcriptional ArsR family regulator